MVTTELPSASDSIHARLARIEEVIAQLENQIMTLRSTVEKIVLTIGT